MSGAIKIAFYKGKGDWSDKLIRWWTSSKYSHVEVIIEDKWYSSSPRDGRVRYKRIIPTLENWDIFTIKGSTKIDVNRIEDFFKRTKGMKYDWFNIIFAEIFGLSVGFENRYICSEWCHEAIYDKHREKISPEKLYRLLVSDKMI